MGFFDIFFGKKLEVQPEVEIVEEKEELKNYKVIAVCSYCEKDIKDNEKYKIIKKVPFHKRCFKKCRREAEMAYLSN